MNCREREKGVAVEKQGENVTPWTLFFISLPGSRHATATGQRLNDPIVEGCNDRLVLPNRPEMALLAFLDVDAAVRTYCGSSDEKVSTPGGRGQVSACQAAVRG
jgi:hypothetical protein